MGRLLDFDFFLAPESAAAGEFPLAEPQPTRDSPTDAAEAWARRAMAASGFGDAEVGGPELPAAARLFIEET